MNPNNLSWMFVPLVDSLPHWWHTISGVWIYPTKRKFRCLFMKVKSESVSHPWSRGPNQRCRRRRSRWRGSWSRPWTWWAPPLVHPWRGCTPDEGWVGTGTCATCGYPGGHQIWGWWTLPEACCPAVPRSGTTSASRSSSAEREMRNCK